MTVDQFREMCHRQPFQPFMIHLADGRQIPVQHREFVIIIGEKRTAIVAQRTGHFDVIDILLVTGFSPQVSEPPPAVSA